MTKAKYPHDANRPSPQAVRRALDNGDMSALELALTIRQRRFAEEYVFDFVGSKAAVRAGYSPHSAGRQAYVLLQHEGVRAYVDHLTRNKATNVVSVSPEYVIQKVTDILGKQDTSDSNKLRALELLARHLGMFIDRTEITGKDGGPIETQRIEEEAKAFNDTLRLLREKAEQARIDSEKIDVELV